MSVRRKTSTTQARYLAHWWGRNEPVRVGGYIDATQAACLTRGWLEPTDEEGLYPNRKTPWRGHRLSKSGLEALGHYLIALAATERRP